MTGQGPHVRPQGPQQLWPVWGMPRGQTGTGPKAFLGHMSLQLRSPARDQIHLLTWPGQLGHDPIPLRSGDPMGAQLRKGLAGKGLAVAEGVDPRQSQVQTGEGQQGNPAGRR